MKQQWTSLEKSFVLSTHRSRIPSETLALYMPLMPRFGITRLANITGLDSIGIPVVVAVRPSSRGLATAQGKGIDLASAKASALMEAIETWHAERIETLARQDTFDELRRGGLAINILQLQCRPGKAPPMLRPVNWILGHDLMTDQPVWIPWESVSCDFSSSLVRQATFLQSTNGLASGNHLMEAIVHALCEVIERDAITLHKYASRAVRAQRQVDPATVEDERCRLVLEKLHEAGVGVGVWDCTSDIGIAVFSVLIADSPDTQRCAPRGPFRGYGCHLARSIALLRALTEAVQSRLTYISGSRDDLFPERFRALEKMGYERSDRLAKSAGTRSFLTVPDVENLTFNQDIEHILSCLRRAGLTEAAVFDLTRQDFGVPVVKVLVPGLENDIHRSGNYRPGKRAQQARTELA